MNADAWSREKWSRMDDTTWHRVQSLRRWLKISSWAWFILAILAGLYLILEVKGIRESILADAARLRAEAAEIRLAIEQRRCQEFPMWCRDRNSVFYQRQPAKRR